MINAYQKKMIAWVALGLIILVLFTWLVINPLLEQIQSISRDYLANQEILARLNQREVIAKQLEESYQSQEKELTDLNRVFLGEEEIVGFISTLEKIARETDNQFEIKAVSSSALEESGQPFLGFQIYLGGSFNNLLRFLAHLENSPYPPYRLVEIENLSIKTTDSDLESVLYIKIYTQDNDEEN